LPVRPRAAAGSPSGTTTGHCPGIASFSEPILPQAPKAPFRDEAASTLAGAGLSMHRVSYARQVHGAEAGRAPEGGGFAGLVDVITTTERGVPPGRFTPASLSIGPPAPLAPGLAAAHPGRRGAVRCPKRGAGAPRGCEWQSGPRSAPAATRWTNR